MPLLYNFHQYIFFSNEVMNVKKYITIIVYKPALKPNNCLFEKEVCFSRMFTTLLLINFSRIFVKVNDKQYIFVSNSINSDIDSLIGMNGKIIQL